MSAENLGGLLDLIADNTISGRIAKDVFAAMVETGKDAAAIVEEKGLARSPTPALSTRAIDKVMATTPTRSPNTAPARTSSSASSSVR